MQDLTIREAIPDDAPGVEAIVNALQQERGRTANAPKLAQEIGDCIAQQTHQILVAASGDALVAYIAVHWVPFPLLGGRECYISDLIVHADWRGRGIGNRLIEAVEEQAVRLGCRRLMLHNWIEDESFRRGFYVKAGFQERTIYATFVKALAEG